MSIFNFTDEHSLGEVRSVETSRITVRVTDGQRLQKARVGRLVAIQSMGDEWLIGIIERVWRHPVELPTLPEADPPADLAGVPQEENGVSISLVGTYRARDGQRKDTFTRAVFLLPEINRPVFPIEEKSLEDFMGILSASSKADAAAPLKVGTYTLDGKASAYIDGDKLFQRHAALLGSTGSGKSFTVASILEQSAQLPHANIVVLDLHGEYSSMKFASHYRIAGIGDLKAKKEGAIFLPFWLLTYDEMQSLFVDRSEESAPNQASELMKQVVELKRKSIEELGKHDLLDGFTVDTPVPYRLADLIDAIAEKDKEMVQGAKGEKQGPLFGKLTRFLNRISVKTKDRRYAFMYQAPAEDETYEALHQLAEKLLGTGVKQEGVNPGIKIVDFSEVPSDILPVVVGLVARIVYQIQFWSSPGEDGDARHPIVIVCDEAHLYLPSSAASTGPLEKRALENFERIAKEGRKYGVGLMVVSQRPSDVSTTILSQCSNIISLRLANKTDQGVVKQLLPESLEGLMEVLPTLDVGEAVVVGDATLLPTRIKMSKPKHEPRSATIPFWTRWATPKAEVDLVTAVENMRRQSRAQED
ncbi:TPA: ATP-binding protein [Pseudomonas aeruginosa]|nr:ATP-binding protein [Pseudomonas aeruginosa]EKT8022038.1 ATP-binding protein [Pseudomonas aeruginosa]EKU2104512.1 ATP-binding protein [Pseudomonas aeruginosa]EKU4785061.1 ATP-binding protein [Pseudomonas aeruginosa]EKU5004517.1 ATP-binding protein [Pseudomonas aeruginosa]